MGFYDIGLTYVAERAHPRTLSESDIFEINSVAGWKGSDLDESVQVVLAESSGQTAVESNNPDGNKNIGMFQIDTVNVKCGNCLKDPTYSANVARRMWKADGGTFSKRWETAAKGNLPKLSHPGGPSDEAQGLLTPVGPYDSSITSVTDFLKKIASGALWQDVGKVVLGGVLLILGVLAFSNELMPKVKALPIPIP